MSHSINCQQTWSKGQNVVTFYRYSMAADTGESSEFN